MGERFRGPVFVVGVPRSGTKLLRELLTRHPRVRIPRTETECFPQLHAYVSRHGGALADRVAFDRMYEWCLRFPYFRYARRRKELISAAQWFATCRAWNAAGLFEALIRHDAAAPFDSDTVWGDKSPSYVSCIGELAAEFPAARFVHIVRDVRDVVLSAHDAWGKDLLRAAQRWSDDVARGMSAGGGVGARYTWLRYEDLTADPRASLERLCEFLALDFDPAMLELERASENIGAARDVRSILANNTRKYVARLSVRELAAIESIAGECAQQLGYPVTAPRCARRLSKASMWWRQGKDAVALVARRSKSLGFREAALFHLRYRQATSRSKHNEG